MRLIVIIFVCLLVVSLCDAQKRNRRKKKGKGRNDPCHMKEAEKCLDSLSKFGKNDNPSSIIATSDGLDKFCSSAKKDFIDCLKDYFKKCGTNLHREVGGLFTDQVTMQLKKFCDKGPEREKFLKSSPCLHEKVFSQAKIKEECNNRYLASLTKVQNGKVKVIETLETICCGYRVWESCSTDIIVGECGNDGVEAFKHLITKGFMGFPEFTCPKDLFQPTEDICIKSVPPKGSAVKLDFSDNGLGKYNVAHMFSFLFKIS